MAEFAIDQLFDTTGYVSGKFFFSQDGDCHWYMIPIEKRHRWMFLMDGDSDDENNNEYINSEFGDYRTGGGISHIEFIPAP